MKRPSFQFYPADWRNDPALRMCSLAARGLWWEMLCVMHTCEPYGHLVAAGKAIEPEELARIVAESVRDVKKWLAELERHQIFSRKEDGTIFSRRMVRDENERGQWRDRQGKSRSKSRESHADVTRNVTDGVTVESRHSSSSSSPSVPFPNGNGRAAPSPNADPWKAVYDRGKEVLGKSSGGIITNLRAHFHDKPRKVLEKINDAAEQRDPLAWINAFLWKVDGPLPENINLEASSL